MTQLFIRPIFALGIFLLAAVNLHAGEEVKVSLKGNPLTLGGKIIQVGETLPDIALPDRSLKMIGMQSIKGSVAIVSVVPSLDTPTCEKQTHILSEENGDLHKDAKLITISRDLPFAQKRFAKGAHIANIIFLSDYRDASFGEATGLLIEENRLLARAVMVLDREGVVRYLEIVPELSQLPDMKQAFAFASSLLKQ